MDIGELSDMMREDLEKAFPGIEFSVGALSHQGTIFMPPNDIRPKWMEADSELCAPCRARGYDCGAFVPRTLLLFGRDEAFVRRRVRGSAVELARRLEEAERRDGAHGGPAR